MRIDEVCWITCGKPDAEGVLMTAAHELADYCEQLTRRPCEVRRTGRVAPRPSTAWVGLVDQLPPPDKVKLAASPQDDAYATWVQEGALHIAGSNARSVLFGVYDFLERQDCVFVRPGPEGTFVPHKSSLEAPAQPEFSEAGYRYRGLCIEGSLSLQQALETVRWAARKRLNSIFLQFHSSRYFFNQYKPLTADKDAEATQADAKLIEEARGLGLQLHRVGHGWTADVMGLPASGWGTTDQAPDVDSGWLAEVDGQRGVFKNIPLNTELCYSNDAARTAFVTRVADYAGSHPEVDLLHVWLSDAVNNKCTCDGCAAKTISDWYIRLINEIGHALKERELPTRIVFLAYIELWWPPETERPDPALDNLVFMFAPISRRYDRRLCAADPKPLPRPETNAFTWPVSNSFFTWSLEAWQECFDGDGFLFDYHLMWMPWTEMLDTRIGCMLHDDIAGLRSLGLEGLVSCQSWRAGYPTGLSMYVLADALWDPRCVWEERKNQFLRGAYGPNAAWVDDYLASLERNLPATASHRDEALLLQLKPAQRQLLTDLLLEALQGMKNKQTGKLPPVQRVSLELLTHHAQLIYQLLGAVELAGDGNHEAAREAFDDTRRFLQHHLKRMPYAADGMMIEKYYIDRTQAACGV